MSNRFDNKKLLYLVAGLIVILILTIFIRIPKEKATLKSKLVAFDTLEVSKIVLYPKFGKDNPIEFNRNNGKWSVQQGNIISAPQKGSVQNIFSEVLSLKPEQLAAINKSKWKEFELTDSLGTRIKIMNKKGKTMADLMIGKFCYKQIGNPNGGYGSNNVKGTSFVRLYKEKEIYAVDGFVSFFFNGKFDDWRDKTFINLKKDDVLNITFNYPADSSYLLKKKDSKWFIGNLLADSVNVSTFLTTLTSMDGQVIKDNFKPVINPAYQLLIEGNNLLHISVKCYKEENFDEYILNSSLNPDVYYSSPKDGLLAKVFKPQSYFLWKKGK
jgi:hypothetical protein